MRKTILQLVAILALITILSPILSSQSSEYPLQETQVYVNPTFNSEPIGATFTIDVGIADVANLAGFDVILGWDPAVLDYVSHTKTPENVLNPMVFTVSDTVNAAAGTYQLAAATLGGAGFTGSGTIFNVTLSVAAEGFSDLALLLHDLADPVPNPIPHTTVNGTFDNRPSVVQYELTISVSGSGTTSPAVGSYLYDEGTVVPVTATPISGWTFDHWVLDTVNVGSANPYSVTMNSDHALTAVFAEIPPVQYQLTITVTGSGTTTPAVGSYMYDEGTIVPVTAVPASGWSLDYWLLDSVNVGNANPYSVTMDSDHALEAVFVEVPPVQYELVISGTGSGTTDPAVGSYMHNEGTVVPVTAFPDSGWTFDHWDLDSVNVGSVNPYSVTMDSNHALTAVFNEVIPPPQYELVISVTGSGTTAPAIGSHLYDEGTVVPVTALPDSGWMLDHWVLDTVNIGSVNPYSVTMDTDHALEAVFVEIPPVQYDLTITVTGLGTTTPAAGTYPYDAGTVVDVTAVPASGWTFDHWLLDSVNVGSANPYSVTMNTNRALEAVFVEIPVQYELTITVFGSGTTDPAVGTYLYDEGTVVPVTATPAAGWTFDHWVLDTVNVGATNPYSVTMNTDHTLQAVFLEAPPVLTQVYVDPTAVSEPVGAQFTVTVGITNVVGLSGFAIRFGWDPAILGYVSHTATPANVLNTTGGTLFTLVDTADAAAGTYELAVATLPATSFTGSGTVFTITLEVTNVGFSTLEFLLHDLSDPSATPISHSTVNGTFDNRSGEQYELTISVTGSGTTTPSVGSYLYDEGTVVPVTASPASGWSLDYWLLDGMNVGNANPYSVTMDSDHALEAVFVEVPPVLYELTISVSGSGSTIPAVGSYLYDAGTVLGVTAVPDSGWMFDFWLLDSVNVGSANPYSVTMDSNHALEAVFVEVIPPVQYELTISVIGSGTTTPVTGSYLYDASALVEVTAFPAGGWTFDHWLLDTVDVGSVNPYTVTMNADHSLTAVFGEVPPPPPSLSSSDDSGAEKNEYNATEPVYVSGAGFDPEEELTIYVVPNGSPFVSTASIFNKAVQADASGVLSPVQLGIFPVGEYDVWVDRDGNGVLDPATEPVDAFDMEVSGFFVIPELFAGTIAGLLACFAALSMLYIRKRRKN